MVAPAARQIRRDESQSGYAHELNEVTRRESISKYSDSVLRIFYDDCSRIIQASKI
jgi:hypothetical protein